MPAWRTAFSIRSSEPSRMDGEAWWSMTVVVPLRMQSIRGIWADRRISSSSSARSTFHHSRSRIWTKLAAGSPGMDMPRAMVE